MASHCSFLALKLGMQVLSSLSKGEWCASCGKFYDYCIDLGHDGTYRMFGEDC